MSKRTLSSLLNGDESEDSLHPRTKPRLETPSYALSYPNTSLLSQKPPPFQQPTSLISFSYNPSRTLEFTDSSLRYFVQPPIGAQLGYGYDRWIRRPEERSRIDGLLSAYSKILSERKGAIGDIAVVAWRGVMTRILTAPYEDRDGWDLNVMLVNGTLYLEEHVSEEKIKEKNNLEPRHRTQMYYGYAFESYCTSETPTRPPADPDSEHPPAWGGDIDTNVQWCSVVRTKLGDMRMVIGGEVDCVKKGEPGSADTLVELKTSMNIRGSYDESKFEKKLLKFYFQSFLLGVPDIVVGFRTPSGQVTTVQTFKTIQIPRLVRGKPGAWDPAICLGWGHRFLTFLKQTVLNQKNDSVWRVRFTPKEGISVAMLDEDGVADVVGGEERVGFLPRWYWDETQRSHPPVSSPPPPPTKTETTVSSTVTSVAGWQI